MKVDVLSAVTLDAMGTSRELVQACTKATTIPNTSLQEHATALAAPCTKIQCTLVPLWQCPVFFHHACSPFPSQSGISSSTNPVICKVEPDHLRNVDGKQGCPMHIYEFFSYMHSRVYQ